MKQHFRLLNYQNFKHSFSKNPLLTTVSLKINDDLQFCVRRIFKSPLLRDVMTGGICRSETSRQPRKTTRRQHPWSCMTFMTTNLWPLLRPHFSAGGAGGRSKLRESFSRQAGGGGGGKDDHGIVMSWQNDCKH